MAGDWIKIECSTPSKPEIDVLAELLQVSVNEVLGGLVRLWIWADQQTIDGNAVSVTKCAIDRHSGVTGLADALISRRVNWLDELQNGGFSFPNFERHNGQTAKRRALTSKRVAECKKRNGNAKVTLSALPREEKRREEKSKKETPLPPSIPIELDSPEFAEAWESWQAHRREIKKPLTPTQAAKQLKQFAEWGQRRAVLAIEHTITKGWQGIREPETNGHSTQQAPQPTTRDLLRKAGINVDD